jgi:hypothetical protein
MTASSETMFLTKFDENPTDIPKVIRGNMAN